MAKDHSLPFDLLVPNVVGKEKNKSRRINQIEMGLLNLQASLSENPEASQAEDFQRLMEDLQNALNRLKGE